MAVFDGLINWWTFGEMAEALVDYGSFAAASAAPPLVFEDHIAHYGLPPHDGQYTMGAQTYGPGGSHDGVAFPTTPLQWACAAGNGEGVAQVIPTTDFIHPTIDPQVGHYGANIGIVPVDPIDGLWFEPRDGWTVLIWAASNGGYYIARQSLVTRQYLMGNHLISSPSTDRGWYIVADLNTIAVPGDPIFTADGLHTRVAEEYTGEGVYRLIFNSGEARFSLSLGPISDGMLPLVFTYDGEYLRTYSPYLNPDGPLQERLTTTGEITFGGQAYSFGSRYNLGTDDNAYVAPWNGAWAEALQWDRALSLDEINSLPHACDAQAKIHSRFKAVNSDGHNRFARARTIRGATGQTVPFDPAGHDTEDNEPQGANLQTLHQTAWYKWTAPSSRTVTFHTAEGHPADTWSAAPVELRS